jgi:hypothetical protein
MEQLHQLVKLAGQYCDFDPVSPLIGKKSTNAGPAHFVSAIKSMKLDEELWFIREPSELHGPRGIDFRCFS